MSRLTNLIAQARAKDPALGTALEAEFRALSSRRQFGLNFERHQPEAVQLPHRPVRKGDKVRVLPPRGTSDRAEFDQRLWRVAKVANVEGGRVAHLTLHDLGDPETQIVAVEDVVVVAEFRDPIYPGLRSTGKVERGGDKPFHTVINAENFHALQTLLYTHSGKIDAIYIDPPYNTGARDWKYNNDYVDGEDAYRHSKWLAFMERRLKLAKQLLNPHDSVLIVTIDEKEVHRLGLLLEQTFPEARIQMVTTIIKPEGTGRRNEFSRTNEFIFFVMLGACQLMATADDMVEANIDSDEDDNPLVPVEWRNLRRRERESVRGSRKNQFYAIFVENETGRVHSVGEALDDDVDRHEVPVPAGCRAVFPLNSRGAEMIWSVRPDTLRRLLEKKFVRYNGRIVQFLQEGTVAALERGDAVISGEDEHGGVIAHFNPGKKTYMPKTLWVKASHNAQASGSLLVKAILGERNFPFPKSLYAVEDTLRFFVLNKPDATVLDFFSGSGTTAHAVMRLNRQDGGRRRSISVTNNEVSADEQGVLRADGLRPGDPEWERLGICDYITKPRLQGVITGQSPDGQPIRGEYKFTDEFPMAEGFEENVEFFTLTYETPWRVARNRDFEKIAPLLWLRAGAQGSRIDTLPADGWAVADTYGVIADLDRDKEFQAAIAGADTVKVAYIVTDDDRRFQMVAAGLPEQVEAVRLYESYLNNFEINTGRE